MSAFGQYIRTSGTAERIVSKKGISAWLIVICTSIMSFLMLYTWSLGSVANQVSNSWRDALTNSATIRIQAKPDAMYLQAAAVEETLRTTPGIEDFTEIASEEQLKLLAPWLGNNIPVEVLTLPRVYSVKTSPDGVDEVALQTRLSAEAPDAIWDNHLRWRGPLLKSAERVKAISWFSTALIATSFVLVIFVAADASIAANATTIALLRQIGATDRWIQSGFERRFGIRCLAGSVLGVAFALLAYYAVLRSNLAHSDFLRNADMANLPWLEAILVVLACLILGFIATRISTSRYLRHHA